MSGSPADLDAIWTALSETGVYVDPTMRSQVSEAEQAEIEENVAASEEPIFVVAYPLDYGDEFGGRVDDLLATLHDHNPEPGLYLGVDPAASAPRIEAKSWDTTTADEYLGYQAGFAAERDNPGDVGAQLVDATQMIADGTVTEEYDAAYAEYEETRETTSTQPSYDDGGSGAAGVSISIAVVAVLVAGALLWRLKSKKPATAKGGSTFTLPDSVLNRVRAAHDQQLTRRADADLLALGEAIDDAEMSSDTATWRSVLDHYDAARRVRGGDDRNPRTPTDVLDIVGVIVLVARGHDALAAAADGRPYEPTSPCFLNPLHRPASQKVTLTSRAERVDVPVCPACRNNLGKGRSPDVLDVVVRGEPVHYFDSGREPWASSGYGAVKPDLVEQVHRIKRWSRR